MLLRTEEARDRDAIAEVNRLAFGQEAEGKLVRELHDAGHVRLSLVADDAGAIVGHVLFSALRIAEGDRVTPALTLAPMAVVPSRQRRGIGSALIREGLRRVTAAGHAIVIVLGHRDYYPRFGFSAALTRELRSPYAGESFMALELTPGALTGVRGDVQYPPPFSAF